ncbi:MAG: DUF6883 domain-containing protein [Chloroflexota bacterium]
MNLPNAQVAVVPEGKITGYLLSTTHRDGRHKAAFFLRFGFTAGEWQTLAAALLNHALVHDAAKVDETPFGTRYVVEGTIETPVGRTPRIRSVWFVESGQDVPRFVTAYPLEGANDD